VARETQVRLVPTKVTVTDAPALYAEAALPPEKPLPVIGRHGPVYTRLLLVCSYKEPVGVGLRRED
jgi:hypothetical protein